MTKSIKRPRTLMIAATAVAAIVILCGVLIIRRYDPLQVTFYPPCVSKLLTGYDCPGCGTARALHALFNGDVARAWHYNAGLMVGLPAFIALIAGYWMPRRWAWARIARHSVTPWLIIAAMLAWGVARNFICPLP